MKKHLRELFLLTFLMTSLPLAVLLALRPVKIQKMALETKNQVVFSLSPSSGTFPLATPFTLKVFLGMPEDTQVVIVSLALNFDPQVLQVKKIRGGKGFSNQIKLDFKNDRGKILFKQAVGGGEAPLSGKVEFAQIELVGVEKNQQAKIVVDEDLSSVVSPASEYLPFEAKPGAYRLQ